MPNLASIARAVVDASAMTVHEPPTSAAARAAGDEPRVMAPVLGLLYAAGATIGLVSIVLPHVRGTNIGALEVNIGLAYGGALVALLLFGRAPRWLFHLALLAGTVLITRAIYYSGEGGVSFYAIWYLWVALYAFSFFTRAEAIAHGVGIAVAFGLVQHLRHEPHPVARWLTTIATLFIAGVFIDALVRRVRRHADQSVQDAASMTAVVHAMQSVFGHASADATRAELCKTAREVASCDFAVLWEPLANGSGIEASATDGALDVSQRLAFQSSHSGPLQAFVSGEVVFVPDARAEPHLVHELGDAAAIASCLSQPVVRDDVTVAVLTVYWSQPTTQLPGNVGAVLSLLAAQVPIAVERADLLARLERMARTDDLTGLPNRRAWEEELPREMQRARREQWPLCVAMVDLDGFKELNDALGHQAGDQLLKQVAASWGSAMRLTDVLVRYGGDEFGVLLPHCGIGDARALIGRLVASTPANQSCSVGLAQWDGDTGADELIGLADAALYEAKRAGGNRIVVATGQ
jgi:diguanylate cyclase (GGDEF)-like protein